MALANYFFSSNQYDRYSVMSRRRKVLNEISTGRQENILKTALKY